MNVNKTAVLQKQYSESGFHVLCDRQSVVCYVRRNMIVVRANTNRLRHRRGPGKGSGKVTLPEP